MTKYYKKYELSLSLNGNDIMHIARNASGIVIFRESSEKALKEAIDRSIENEAKRIAEAQAKAKKTKKVVKLLSVEEVPVEDEEETTSEESILNPASQQRITRGPDGKFISKSALAQGEGEQKKKGFWQKLTS